MIAQVNTGEGTAAVDFIRGLIVGDKELSRNIGSQQGAVLWWQDSYMGNRLRE
jgi:hypothetical protein